MFGCTDKSKILLGAIELVEIIGYLKKGGGGGVVKGTSVGIMRISVWSSEANANS